MKFTFPGAVLALLFTLSSAHASTLVHNVTGYTMDMGERIQFVGLEYDAGVVTQLHRNMVSINKSEAQTRIDGQGATLLPGLIDAHGHITIHGRALASVRLFGATSEAEAAQRVVDFMAANPGQEWIVGRGWNQVLWPGKEFPTRASLDRISGQAAVALNRVDGHAMWANSVALKLAGIDRNTPDPQGGAIIRDAAGEPTGVLIDNAKKLVLAVMPPQTDESIAALQTLAIDDLISLGVTSVHEAGSKSQYVRAYQLLKARGDLPLRVYSMLDDRDESIITYLRDGPIIDPDNMLTVRAVKIYADGALGSRGAALFEDYSDEPGNKGLLLADDEKLERSTDRAMAAGFQVCIHAIGDLANARVLDYLERQMKKHETRHLRHRDEHTQIVRLEDIPRFKELGVIASIQPAFATSDKNMAADRLGEDRLAGAYAWRKLIDSGAHVAGGSDFPVESPNPFFGLHAAVTRQSQDNLPEGGWLPNEKLTREQALSLFTEDAAYAAHQENSLGKLLPGFAADFILVEDDYFTVPEQDIWKNTVKATYVAGRRVYPQ